jgi:N-glycosylase/DNA lyase
VIAYPPSSMLRAVEVMCEEVSNRPRGAPWLDVPERDLIGELVACILGSQVPFEIGVAAAQRLRDRALLPPRYAVSDPESWESAMAGALSEPIQGLGWPVRGRRYRFPISRARHVRRTYAALSHDSATLRSILRTSPSARDARRRLTTVAVGIGPKQASLFLRNVGFSDDLAILDSHVLRYMHVMGLAACRRPPATLAKYEALEDALASHARRLGHSLAIADLAIWVVVRVASRGNRCPA